MTDSENKNSPQTNDADETMSQQSSSKNNAEGLATKTKSSPAYFMLILLLIMAVTTAAGGFYLWQQQQTFIKKQLANIDDLQLQLQQFKKLSRSKSASLNKSIQQNNALINNLDSSQKQLEDLSQKAIQFTSRGQKGWILAEIDYLLRIAHRRLQIARDINGAIAALQGANQRIYDLGDLSLFNIRQQLSKDMGQLKALHQIDVNSTAMAIDQMILNLTELPFKSIEDEVTAQFKNNTVTNEETVVNNGKTSFVDSVINTVMKIGEIKIIQRSLEPASSSKQQEQLQQIMRSHLLGARLAVLRYDQKQFSHDMQQARNILHLHYKENDNRVSQMQNDLSAFLNLNLAPDLPDITKSWDLLQLAIKEAEITQTLTPTKKHITKKYKPKAATVKTQKVEVL